jgi:hydrogenase maturation factor
MCLTIPKKVVGIEDNLIRVEKPDGTCENLKSIVDLNVGDFVFSQQEIIIQKLSAEEAQEVLSLFKNNKEKGEKAWNTKD